MGWRYGYEVRDSRVAANGAAPPGAEPTAVTSALRASTGWGCSRTGPASDRPGAFDVESIARLAGL